MWPATAPTFHPSTHKRTLRRNNSGSMFSLPTARRRIRIAEAVSMPRSFGHDHGHFSFCVALACSKNATQLHDDVIVCKRICAKAIAKSMPNDEVAKELSARGVVKVPPPPRPHTHTHTHPPPTRQPTQSHHPQPPLLPLSTPTPMCARTLVVHTLHVTHTQTHTSSTRLASQDGNALLTLARTARIVQPAGSSGRPPVIPSSGARSVRHPAQQGISDVCAGGRDRKLGRS